MTDRPIEKGMMQRAAGRVEEEALTICQHAFRRDRPPTTTLTVKPKGTVNPSASPILSRHTGQVSTANSSLSHKPISCEPLACAPLLAIPT